MLNTKSLIAVVALTPGMAGAANAQAYVNLTVSGPFVPGVFGQVSFANAAPPPVMDAYPVVVGQPVYEATPIYLHVALHEYRDRCRYCRRYQACAQPVHFVLIDQNNPWWARPVENRQHHYRSRHHDRQNHEGYWDPRFESKRGER